MKQFIIELGYVALWAFGTPKQSPQENQNDYFGAGIFLISIAFLFILLCIAALLITFKQHKKEE